MSENKQLPGYTNPDIKKALLDNGASGTIYALVMPESEAALAKVIDGGDRNQIIMNAMYDWQANVGNLEALDDDGKGFPSFLVERPGEVFRHLKYTRLHYVNADESELGPEERDDPTIGWLRGYPNQKYAWLHIWSEHYGELEDSMLKFQAESKDLGRQAAADNHVQWLKSVSKNGVPFYDAAEKFAPSYVERISEYNEDMEATGHKVVARKDNSKQQVLAVDDEPKNDIDAPENS